MITSKRNGFSRRSYGNGDITHARLPQEAHIGLSSSKTKQTNGPSSFSKPYIDAGAGALQSAYGTSSNLAAQVTNQFSQYLPQLQAKAFANNTGIDAANDYNTSVLGGKYLGAANPFIQGQIDQTGADVTARVQAAFSQAGRTGSGANVNALGRGLASAENALRYQDYDNERARMASAAALAPSLNTAQFAAPAAYLSLAQSAAGLPLSTAQGYAGSLGSLLGNYSTQTGTQSQSLGSLLGQVAGAGLAGWASGGFKKI